MQIIRYPKRKTWNEILKRPAFETQSLEKIVSGILEDVKNNGDCAVKNHTKKFDQIEFDDLQVSAEEIARAETLISDELKNALHIAQANIAKFHEAQKEKTAVIETSAGVFCWRKSVGIEKVGLYIPGGTAPLFSTVLMLGVPARIAGCSEIILCSPPDQTGSLHPAILYAARLCGIEKIFKIGGAQAVGALAYGTESVPKVYKIFGPGNQFVTAAKQFVARDGLTALDLPAGPSEVAVYADETSIPSFVAADLLSQAEHGADSQVLLISTDLQIIEKVLSEVDNQIIELPRRAVAFKALKNSRAILVKNENEAVDLLNEYAAEHLILACREAEKIAEQITNAGSIFLGNYSCEAAGDYASGTNHTLPTGGFAKIYGGVSLDSFTKKITVQKLTKDGIKNLGGTIETLAAAENLDAHRRAVSIRLEQLASVAGENENVI